MTPYYYLHNNKLRSIFSAVLCIIWHTLPFAFPHQSWCKHMHPFTPLINYSYQILTFDKNPVPTSRTCPPITIHMTPVKNLLFPSKIILLLNHVKKSLLLVLSDPYLPEYIYDHKNQTSTSPLLWSPYKNYTKPAFPTTTKNAHSLFPNVHRTQS